MHGKRTPEVVIVGGGFAGLTAARSLAHLPVHLTLIDRKNHHTFQPLLYQVATAGLSPGEIAVPIRWILRGHKNIQILLGEVVDFDLTARRAKLRDAEVSYDYLVVASGVRHAYFSHNEWEPLAPGLKTVEDAIEIRRRVLLAFELAESQAARGLGQTQLTFVVIGGGPTGVELAGTLAEIARRVLADEFHSIDPRMARILLVEGGARILPSYPEDLSLRAEKQLRNLGVEVMTSAMVTSVEADGVRIGTTRVPAAVILWAAGVAASPLGTKLGGPVDRVGRVLVEKDLSLRGHREVFVIGDLAALKDAQGKWLPGVAPAAMQQGKAVAASVRNDLAGEPRKAFHYIDKGSLATIGRSAAVAQFGKVHVWGFAAWLAWLFIHIFFLIGFRNRLIVMIQWAWSYFTYERGARLITGETRLPSGTERALTQQPKTSAAEGSERAAD